MRTAPARDRPHRPARPRARIWRTPPRPQRPLLPLTAAALVLLAAGCSGNGDRKPVYPVRGRVLYEGKPAAHALVVFHPLADAGKGAVLPRGQVGADGTFTLTTYDANDGAPAGEYAVTVEWWLSTATTRTREGDGTPPVNRLPPRYARPQTSGLRVKIGEGDNQLPAFQLKK
jgi:hypothetical protein